MSPARARSEREAAPRRRRHGRVLRLALPADRSPSCCSASTTRSRCRPSPASAPRWYVDFFHDSALIDSLVASLVDRRGRGRRLAGARARCSRSAWSGSGRAAAGSIGAVTLLPLVTPEIVTGVAALLLLHRPRAQALADHRHPRRDHLLHRLRHRDRARPAGGDAPGGRGGRPRPRLHAVAGAAPGHPARRSCRPCSAPGCWSSRWSSTTSCWPSSPPASTRSRCRCASTPRSGSASRRPSTRSAR